MGWPRRHTIARVTPSIVEQHLNTKQDRTAGNRPLLPFASAAANGRYLTFNGRWREICHGRQIGTPVLPLKGSEVA